MKHVTHQMSLKQPYFNYISQGTKTIELRLYDDKRSIINPGDRIVFSNNDGKLTVMVKGMVRAENFESLFDIIDVKQTGLEERSKAVAVMEQFYDKKAQEKYGVVGIIVEKMEE